MESLRKKLDDLDVAIKSTKYLKPEELALDQANMVNTNCMEDNCGYTTRQLKLMLGDFTEIDYLDLEFLIKKNMFHTIKKYLKPELVKPELLDKCKFLSIAKLLNVKPISNKPLEFAEKINNQPLVEYYRDFRSVTRREQLVEGCDLDASTFVCDDLTMDELKIAVGLGYKLRLTNVNEVKMIMPNKKIFDKLVNENNIEIVREIIGSIDRNKTFDLRKDNTVSDEMLTMLLDHDFKIDYVSPKYLSHSHVCLLIRRGQHPDWFYTREIYKAYVECGVINSEVIDCIIDCNDVATLAAIDYDFTNFKLVTSDPNIVRVVSGKGFNINSYDRQYKKTIMHHAIKTKNLDLVKYLVENGIDMTHLDYKGKSYYDAASKIPKVLELLPAAGV